MSFPWKTNSARSNINEVIFASIWMLKIQKQPLITFLGGVMHSIYLELGSRGKVSHSNGRQILLDLM